MTRAEWDALSARERDAVVAEKVMGWVLMKGDRRYGSPHGNVKGGLAGIPTSLIHPYTTSWDAMREVVEKMREKSDGHFTLLAFTTNWRAKFDTPWQWDTCPGQFLSFVEATTAPEAVCIAALTALGEIHD